MTHGSLFSGIGGFDLAAEWVGWENLFHCEWNQLGQKVLKYYWPNAESFTDITKTNFSKYENKIDILTGGFPCQPYSTAGKRRGKEDERHLWPEMLRAIREIRPRWIVGENVFGLINWSNGLVFHEVQTDLESAGYEVQPFLLPAAAVNAPHRRDRIWFIAHANNQGTSKRTNNREWKSCKSEQENRNKIWNYFGSITSSGITSNTNSNGLHRSNSKYEKQSSKTKLNALSNIKQILTNWQNFPTVAPLCTGNDGISTELDGITFSKWRNETIKAAGNAICPQVALQIFNAINEYENL